MRVNKCFILPLMLFLAACAGNRTVGDNNSATEYVEVSNPAYTMSPGAPATVWVPKSSVESGLPRAGAAIKMAYESVKGSQSNGAAPLETPPVSAAMPTSTALAQSISSGMRHRVTILETGHNSLTIPFKEKLRALPNAPVISIAPESSADKLLSRVERADYAVTAWKDSGATVSLFVSAPDGLSSGKYLSAEIYDGMGAGLISTVDAIIPVYDAKDPSALSSAVASSIALLAERARNGITLLPWYAKIVAIEGDKIYINAGHEAGINMGQKLNILRGGKIVQGLGFAPGTAVGALEVSGFVGSNGAIATVKGDVQAYLTDIVSPQ